MWGDADGDVAFGVDGEPGVDLGALRERGFIAHASGVSPDGHAAICAAWAANLPKNRLVLKSPGRSPG